MFLVELTYLLEVNARSSKYFFESHSDAKAFYDECGALYESGHLAGFSIVFFERLTFSDLTEELDKLRRDYPDHYERDLD